MNALLLEAAKGGSGKVAFKEISAVLVRHGYGTFWGRIRPLLWAALPYPWAKKQYEAGLEDALERIGHLLNQHRYGEGWTIFYLEIRPWLC
jgi:hypothetical protein